MVFNIAKKKKTKEELKLSEIQFPRPLSVKDFIYLFEFSLLNENIETQNVTKIWKMKLAVAILV